MYRLNIYEKVKHFRETLTKSINESGLSAEVIHISTGCLDFFMDGTWVGSTKK